MSSRSRQIETVGDGIIVVGGLESASTRAAPALEAPPDWGAPLDPSQRRPLSHVGKTALFALDILREVELMNETREATGCAPLAMRIGLHVGDAVGGIVGASRPRYFVWGPETAIAGRLESTGIAGSIQVSAEVASRLYYEGFRLRPRQSPEDEDLGTADACMRADSPVPPAAPSVAGTAVPASSDNGDAPRAVAVMNDRPHLVGDQTAGGGTAASSVAKNSARTFMLDAFQFQRTSERGHAELVDVMVHD